MYKISKSGGLIRAKSCHITRTSINYQDPSRKKIWIKKEAWKITIFNLNFSHLLNDFLCVLSVVFKIYSEYFLAQNAAPKFFVKLSYYQELRGIRLIVEKIICQPIFLQLLNIIKLCERQWIHSNQKTYALMLEKTKNGNLIFSVRYRRKKKPPGN